ncbi:MAG: PKD domain-containing protein, partial [Dehalococcoidia bacterium]
SNEQNPTHIFKREGLYSVSLTVFGPDCQHTLSRTGYIRVYPVSQCMADFIASTTAGTGVTTVQFTDMSTGDIDTWAWDLDGDGAIDSTKRNPKYTYSKNGYYTISLTVTGRDCDNTLTKKSYIRITGCRT